MPSISASFLYEIIPSYCVRIVAEVEGLGADEKLLRMHIPSSAKSAAKGLKELPPVPAKAPDAGAELAKNCQAFCIPARASTTAKVISNNSQTPFRHPGLPAQRAPNMTITHLNSFLTDLNDVNKLVNTKTKALSKARLYRKQSPL